MKHQPCGNVWHQKLNINCRSQSLIFTIYQISLFLEGAKLSRPPYMITKIEYNVLLRLHQGNFNLILVYFLFCDPHQQLQILPQNAL